MRSKRTMILWVIEMIVWMGIVWGVWWWVCNAPSLGAVAFESDWIVWAGCVFALWMALRVGRSPWRKAVTHETKLRWWHKIVMRIPVVGTVAIQMTMMAQRVGVAHGVRHGWSRCLAAKGSHKRSHKRQIAKAIEEAMVI